MRNTLEANWDCTAAIGRQPRQDDRWAAEDQPVSDASGAREKHSVAVICDGLRGGSHSDAAAWAATQGFLQAYWALHVLPVRERAARALGIANGAVADIRERWEANDSTGTTLAAATIGPAGLSWISAGDCRIYHWKPDGGADGWLRRLNPLHNPPGEPDRLTSYLAGSAIPETAAPHAAWEPLEAGDAVIVASDGIATLSDDELAASIRAYDPTRTLSPSLAVWLVCCPTNSHYNWRSSTEGGCQCHADAHWHHSRSATSSGINSTGLPGRPPCPTPWSSEPA